jgi:hypothetical protein
MNEVDRGPLHRVVTVFFSSPGDLAFERAKLVSVVDEMRPAFARRGVVLVPWVYETDAVPAAAPLGGSVQTVIDKQLPRNADGSLAYNLYVGLMGRRVGTPLSDAPSGTLHEFNEAKAAFEETGKPHILFYFRKEESGSGTKDAQFQGVIDFRAQYPGLFASFHSITDLEPQFRRHLLSELLDLFVVGYVPSRIGAEGWSRLLFERYAHLHPESVTFLDKSPEKPQRIIRHLHELLGINYHLTGREQQVLLGALYCMLLETDDKQRMQELLDAPDILNQVISVIQASQVTSNISFRPTTQLRLDLLAVLLKIGLRLDVSRKGITASGTSLPDIDGSSIEEWLAVFTVDIVCQRGVLRFHLVAPDERWIAPLVGATVVAMENLWQQVRPVLTQHDMSFAVARPHIEIAGDIESLPDALLERVQTAAEEATSTLPKFPHFGESGLPRLEDMLPLPISKVRVAETFYSQIIGRLRLIVNGTVVAERAAGESENIDYLPNGNVPVECVLECNELGVFVPVVCCRLQRLSPMEEAVLDSSQDQSETLRSLGLLNDLLRMIWPRVAESRADASDLLDAFHILRNALDAASQDNNSLLERRDRYWDAINIVRNRIEEQKVTI